MKTKGREKERKRKKQNITKIINECLGLGRNKVFESQEFENIILTMMIV